MTPRVSVENQYDTNIRVFFLISLPTPKKLMIFKLSALDFQSVLLQNARFSVRKNKRLKELSRGSLSHFGRAE